MVPFVPLSSKPTTTRLEAEEEKSTIEATEEGPSRVKIPHLLVPTPMLCSQPTNIKSLRLKKQRPSLC